MCRVSFLPEKLGATMLQRIINLAFIGYEDADKEWLDNELANPKSPIFAEIQFASNRWLSNYNYVTIGVSKVQRFASASLTNIEVLTQYKQCTDPDRPNETATGSMTIGSYFHPDTNTWSHHS